MEEIAEVNEFTTEDLIRLLLALAGYEEKRMPFDIDELQCLLFDNYDRLPTLLRSCTYFNTCKGLPNSPYLERVFKEFNRYGVLQKIVLMQLAPGTSESCINNDALPDAQELEVIRELVIVTK